MAKQRSSFAKLQRDKAKKEKAAQKRASRLAKNSPVNNVQDEEEVDESGQLVPGEGELSAPQMMALVEDLNKRRAAGTITAEELEDAKVEIFTRLPS